MTASALLDELARRGVRVRVVGDRLRLGPAKALGPELLAEARRLKPELVAALQREFPPAASPSELLRLAGNLAAEINAHLEGCRTCRMARFTTANPAPLCRTGLKLRGRYREARLAALVLGRP
jgi:hypothetical protein